MLSVSSVSRKLIYKGNQLQDFPDLPIREAIKMNSNQHPEIIGAEFTYKGIDEETGEEIYECEASAGVKG